MGETFQKRYIERGKKIKLNVKKQEIRKNSDKLKSYCRNRTDLEVRQT